MFQLDQRRFNRFALLAVAAGPLLLLVAFAATVSTALGSTRAANWVRHTYQVSNEIDRLGLAIDRSETAARGYLLAPDPRRIVARQQNVALIEPSIARIRELTRDNPRQHRTLDLLRAKIADQIATSTEMMNDAMAGKLTAAREEFGTRVKVKQIEEIRSLTDAMGAEEARLLSQRIDAERNRRQLAEMVLAATGLLMLLLGGLAFWLVRRYTIDLARTTDRLNLLNTNLEAEVDQRTAGLLRANEELQRFAYIVSHDLRSPLVNILGFTSELEQTNKALGGLIERAEVQAPQIVTDDCRDARQDLPEAIGFIRSSAHKMDRLINAILNLSRQGRRVLAPEYLKMERVIGEVIATLATQTEQRRATITIDGPLPEINHDRLAIDQIFQNLLENATKYIRPGTPGKIVVRGQQRGDRAMFEVEDNGRGVDRQDHERIFELFRRAGSQDQRGEGIGLAHVRSLAYRIGGTVTIRSELNEGSTFIVDLPMTYAKDGE